ncbi:exosome RNA helicase MTR4-like [Styela clava]
MAGFGDNLFDVFEDDSAAAGKSKKNEQPSEPPLKEEPLKSKKRKHEEGNNVVDSENESKPEKADQDEIEKMKQKAIARVEQINFEENQKKMKIIDQADDLASILESLPKVETKSMESLISGCNHEVAFTIGVEVPPLRPRQGPPAKQYKFILDPFQQEALLCLDNNQSVLVSAHTSAGKTVVAEYAIAMSLRDKQRVIYTTPIKALSNQKYRELYEEFSDVGLMTGDVTINPTASCLVMTTEILRSMLYRGSEVMREVAWVVFDEIHYMRNKERGVVWEETIILLPDNVRYVFLSATIPNARQFAEWICHLHKQPCHVVYTDYRPVPLQHYVFPAGGDGLHLVVDENGNFREDNFNTAMAILRDAGDNAKSDYNRRGKKGGQQGANGCFKIVKMIMERSFQPVIVFSFSKKECEFYALQTSKLDFNSADEKKLVSEVFTNAIDSLNEEDRSLPQVEAVLPLLKRGIGIHHGGLLPILKETIEILFSEGLIKCLFATETFAMGVNMPARTVLFTSTRKFDGKDFRWITGGEYIQMSGRAGRRGMDDRGIVIIMVDEKMSPSVGKNLLKGSPDPLNSAFRLTYNMVLNLLRVEEINPEYMLEKSFYQFQHYKAVPEIMDKVKNLEKEYDEIKISDEDVAMNYYKIRQQLGKLAGQMEEFIHMPKYCLPFLQPGRLVKVNNGSDEFGWGVIVNFQKAPKSKILDGEEQEQKFVVDILVNVASESIKNKDSKSPRPAGYQGSEKSEMAVIPFMLHLIKSISSIRLYLPKDLRPPDNRQSLLRSLQEVQKRFPDGIPLLDPVEDLGIRDDRLRSIVRKIEAFEHRMYQHPLHEDKHLKKIYKQCEEKSKIANDIKDAKRELKRARTILQMDELKCRKRVLRRLGYATMADVIETKGRVACEISSGDELLLTELIFNGVFNNLSVQQCCALLSCFIFEEKAKDIPKLSEELSGPLRKMHEAARRIAKVSIEAKMTIEEEEYVESFKWTLMDVVHSWCNGANFGQICQMTDTFEGSIIRCMRRLEELLREMCHAAKAIGNTQLENKFAEGITKIKRDIVFAASLYL